MGAAENQSFRDFVSREQAGLLRLAILLAGDRGHAEDLVQIALMKSYRHWTRICRSGNPSAYVRRALVTSHTSWRRRLSTTEQVMETLPERADPFGVPDAEDEELRRALRSLPPRMRTALVLRFYEDLSEQRHGRTDGLFGQHGEHADRPWAGSPACSSGGPASALCRPGGAVVMEETELRTRLETLADHTVPPAQEPGKLTATVVARHRAQRRRQWAVAAAVAVVLVLVPAVRLPTSPEPQPAAPTEKVDIFRGPTRGSLAGDTELVNAIRRLPWAFEDDPVECGARDGESARGVGRRLLRRAVGTRGGSGVARSPGAPCRHRSVGAGLVPRPARSDRGADDDARHGLRRGPDAADRADRPPERRHRRRGRARRPDRGVAHPRDRHLRCRPPALRRGALRRRRGTPRRRLLRRRRAAAVPGAARGRRGHLRAQQRRLSRPRPRARRRSRWSGSATHPPPTRPGISRPPPSPGRSRAPPACPRAR